MTLWLGGSARPDWTHARRGHRKVAARRPDLALAGADGAFPPPAGPATRPYGVGRVERASLSQLVGVRVGRAAQLGSGAGGRRAPGGSTRACGVRLRA